MKKANNQIFKLKPALHPKMKAAISYDSKPENIIARRQRRLRVVKINK